MTILVTGGTGYIGAHVAVELLESGHDVVILDNLSNSHYEAVKRIEEITGKTVKTYIGDIADRELLEKILDENPDIEGVIHLAGLKSVPESIEKPLEYYKNNVSGTIALLEVLQEKGVKNFVFSSSATVYGQADEFPITEESSRKPATNPYGQTKIMIEEVLEDLYRQDPSQNIVILRYFNPIGAHESGLIGDDPKTITTSLVSGIESVLKGEIESFKVYGDDYDTRDGTGIRDYIHVVDLAQGHVKALEHLKPEGSLQVYNLGTSTGSSVLEILKAFEEAIGEKIKYEILPRRAGDVAMSYCNTDKAKHELNWEPKRDLKKMCEDYLNWEEKNPNGYSGARDGT